MLNIFISRRLIDQEVGGGGGGESAPLSASFPGDVKYF